MHWHCVCFSLLLKKFSFNLSHICIWTLCSSGSQRRHLLLSMNMAVCGITLPFWSLRGSDMSYCHVFSVWSLCVCGCVKEKVKESSDRACLFFLVVIPTPKWLVNVRPCNSPLNGTPDHFTTPNCHPWLSKVLLSEVCWLNECWLKHSFILAWL